MMRYSIRLATLVAGLALAAGPAAGQAVGGGYQTGIFKVVPVVEGFQEIWSMTWLPNGDMLVTEQPGRLRLVKGGVLQPEPIAGVPRVRYAGQGGLMDVVLHPQFATNRLVYLSFSKPNADGSQGTTVVVRGRLEGNRLEGVEEIWEADAWGERNGHYGSRLAFDRDGFLFVTVGDRQQPPTGNLRAHGAQDLSNHQGTINRLHDDGRVPADNPFVDRAGAEPSIWSYGHRSPQGLAFHPVTGELWETEHGPQGGDELNRIVKGANYGWPVIGYGVNYGGAPIHEGRERDGMEQPFQFWVPSIGASSLMIYTGDKFPSFRNGFFVGGLVGMQLAYAPVQEDARTIGRIAPSFLTGIGRIREVKQGPDGFIYLGIENRPGDNMSYIVRLEPGVTPSTSR